MAYSYLRQLSRCCAEVKESRNTLSRRRKPSYYLLISHWPGLLTENEREKRQGLAFNLGGGENVKKKEKEKSGVMISTLWYNVQCMYVRAEKTRLYQMRWERYTNKKAGGGSICSAPAMSTFNRGLSNSLSMHEHTYTLHPPSQLARTRACFLSALTYTRKQASR